MTKSNALKNLATDEVVMLMTAAMEAKSPAVTSRHLSRAKVIAAEWDVKPADINWDFAMWVNFIS